MRGLVREERDLREDDAEGARDEQLEPAVTEQDEAGDAAAEGQQDAGGDGRVEPACAVQQTGFADHLQHVLVRVRHRRELGVAGVGLTNRSECAGRFDVGGCGDAALLPIGALEPYEAKGGCRSLVPG